jgi:hypothetical protein
MSDFRVLKYLTSNELLEQGLPCKGGGLATDPAGGVPGRCLKRFTVSRRQVLSLLTLPYFKSTNTDRIPTVLQPRNKLPA